MHFNLLSWENGESIKQCNNSIYLYKAFCSTIKQNIVYCLQKYLDLTNIKITCDAAIDMDDFAVDMLSRNRRNEAA